MNLLLVSVGLGVENKLNICLVNIGIFKFLWGQSYIWYFVHICKYIYLYLDKYVIICNTWVLNKNGEK